MAAALGLGGAQRVEPAEVAPRAEHLELACFLDRRELGRLPEERGLLGQRLAHPLGRPLREPGRLDRRRRLEQPVPGQPGRRRPSLSSAHVELRLQTRGLRGDKVAKAGRGRGNRARSTEPGGRSGQNV